MLEKRFIAVSPQSFTSNGQANGTITVADTTLFKVKQEVIVNATALPTLDTLEIKRINNINEMVVGPRGANINSVYDVSLYTTALGANISANEQKRPSIPFEESTRAVYEEEPTVAVRSMLVYKLGNDYRTDNPLPVQLSDGSINIGTVNAELEVQLSHKDNVPHSGDVADSVRIGDGVDELEINSDGSINIVPGLGPGGSYKSVYSEVTSVASSVLTTILTYTTPALTSAKIRSVDVSGTNIAQFQVEVNASVIDKKRTYFSGPLNEVFNFSEAVSLIAGDIVTIRVIHVRPDVGDFNARLSVLEQV